MVAGEDAAEAATVKILAARSDLGESQLSRRPNAAAEGAARALA